MGISLKKGDKINIGHTNVTIGLGWKPAAQGASIDLDASAFLLDANKFIPTEEHFVFYNNLKSPDGSVKHSGDDKTGESSAGGDDEQISVNIATLDEKIKEILFVATSHTGQNFGQIGDSYIRIIDNVTGEEIAKYMLDENFSIETGVEFGRLYNINNEWKFSATGIGYNEDLSFFVEKYYSGNVTK